MTKPSDKKHPLGRPFRPELIVNVGAIHDNDRPALDGYQMGRLDIAMECTSEVNEPRHVVVVIQQHVSLDATFDFLKLCPWKQRQTQRNGGRIQGEQLVFKTKRLRTRSQHGLATKPFQRCPE
jgi:hypothetical protein